MYFPIGWPKFYNSSHITGFNDALKVIRFNRSRSLFITLSNTRIYLWKTRPRVVLAIWHRDDKAVHEQGINQDVYWSPDSSMLAVVTADGYVVLLDIFEVDKEYVYYLEPINSRYSAEQLQSTGVLKIELSHRLTLTLKGKVTSISPRIEELFITTTEGRIHCVSWNGVTNQEVSCHVSDLLFCVDLETPTVGSPLAKADNIYITKFESSPVLGGFAIVLSDGRGGFLSSSTADLKPGEIIGVFAKDLTNAVCLSVNIKYQIIVFGLANGQAVAYAFDDMTGGLVVSHKYILPKNDYPDQGINLGSIFLTSWTPDGSALATIWSTRGFAVWSVFGALLMCVRSTDHYGDVFRRDTLPIFYIDWGFEGYELLLLPNTEKNKDLYDVSVGDIMSLKFVKSALSVNPCMSNRQHLFLQSDDSVYLNTGDVMLQTTQSNVMNGTTAPSTINSPSMHFNNKHWQTFQLPSHYINSNWPIRYAAIDYYSKYMAVAGIYGYAHFSLARRKWKLFGNETQEKSVTCRGGLTWWQTHLIVGCYNFQDETDEVRIHNRRSNLDAMQAFRIKIGQPIFLINTYSDILLVYCADCSVTFYKLQNVVETEHASGISAMKMSETSLIDYLIHPITVTSLSLTGLKSEHSSVEVSTDDKEAYSLIANVAGRVLMLQKDKPMADSTSTKINFLTPVVLASCVENLWYMVNPISSKQHLAESLWLACGAQGMQAWLPLFPTRRPLGFLSKRIMLHFNLQLYPLAVLFEDAVILGIGNEDAGEYFAQSPLVGTVMPIPYFTLERTTQVFLPQILKQLLRRNLGVHALDIARSCTTLPYFTHVLELMLHEVLEKEATASNPIPDPLLPRVVQFIQEFPQFLETVCHCARKTEVALWPHLFSIVGNPIELFKSCHATNKLEIAASYLLVIQSLTPDVSRQHATILLEKALDKHMWQLATDLVRFLRAIGKGDNESPPRTPVYLAHKTSFHQNLSSSLNLSSANLEDSLSSPVMIPPQRQNSRSSVSIGTPRSSSSTVKDRAGSLKEKHRPGNLKLTKRESNSEKLTLAKTVSSPSKPVTVESCEHFYTETILSRHARNLLSTYSLNDLGTFAAHLDFDLLVWLTKERFRAAHVDDFQKALSVLHETFDWPYPTLASVSEQVSYLRSQSQMSQKEVCNRLDLSSEVATPTTPLGSDISYPNITGDDIEARLVSVKDESGSGCYGSENMSDASSLVTLEEIHSERSLHPRATPLDENLSGFEDMQNAVHEYGKIGPPKSATKLRYLLKQFEEARCLDWVIVISLMLFDITRFLNVIEKISSFKDLTKTRLDTLLSLLHDLYDWLEKQCPAYQPLLNTMIANCEVLYHNIEKEPVETIPLEKNCDVGPESRKASCVSFGDEHEKTEETAEPLEDDGQLTECVIA